MVRIKRIIIIMFVTSGSWTVCSQSTDSCRNLEVKEFYIQLQSSDYPLILDTRSLDEFRKERLPEAVLAESREDLEKLVDTVDRDREIFVYCEKNKRSPIACQILREKGFRKVYILKDGLAGWRRESYSLDRKKISPNPSLD